MALDKEYFDSIQIDLVKKKYYNANKVHAVFDDIRRQAEAMNAELEALRSQLGSLDDRRYEIGGAVLSAQNIYREVLAKANERAEEIIAEAELRRKEIIEEAQRRQEYAVQRVESCYTKMKEQHLSCIEAINAEWQDFLCGLFPEEDEAPKPSVPEDLEQKVDALAGELFSIENGEAEQ